MEEQEQIYTLVVNRKRIPVTRKVYKAYYMLKERERYLNKLAEKNHISIDECEEKGVQVDYLLSHTQESVEDKLIKAEMFAKLMLCLDALSEQERLLIYLLFFEGKSERTLCDMLGMAKTTLHDRKQKILSKLKKMLEM